MEPTSPKLGAILEEVVLPVLLHPKQGSQQGCKLVPVSICTPLFLVLHQPDYVGLSTQTSVCNEIP